MILMPDNLMPTARETDQFLLSHHQRTFFLKQMGTNRDPQPMCKVRDLEHSALRVSLSNPSLRRTGRKPWKEEVETVSHSVGRRTQRKQGLLNTAGQTRIAIHRDWPHARVCTRRGPSTERGSEHIPQSLILKLDSNQNRNIFLRSLTGATTLRSRPNTQQEMANTKWPQWYR